MPLRVGIFFYNIREQSSESSGITKTWRAQSMRSLTEKFNELRSVLRQGLGSVRPTGFDPVYYLIFPPEEMLAVKQRMPEWEAQLKIDGFEVYQLSMIDVINRYFRNHSLHDEWREAAKLQKGDFA